jgi:hypothetical protein
MDSRSSLKGEGGSIFGETGLAGFIIAGAVGVTGLGLYASQITDGLTAFSSA